MGRRFLYARELAEFLGKSGQTLYMWRKQGRGPKWYIWRAAWCISWTM